MSLKKSHKSILVGFLFLALLYAITPIYLKRAIIYLFPGIEDHSIFENRVVENAEGIPWPESSSYMNQKLNKVERDTLEHFKTTAFLIIKEDSVLYEEYWDHFDSTTISNSFSAAKSIVSLLIGAAIDDGYIKSVNQSIGDFIPEFKDNANNQVTIKNLLTMSSGLNWNESYANPFSMTTKAYYGENVNELVTELQLVETPGKDFKYKSGNTQLLAIIIKNATGKTLSEYASIKLWKPLGATNNALWSLDKKDGDEKAYCCFYSNARDFARIGSLILHKGVINEQQLISPSYIEASTSPATYLNDPQENKPVQFYGYQWWIANLNEDQIPYARGIYGQYIFILKKEKAIIVRLGHKRSKTKINHHPSEIYSYIKTAKRILNTK